MKPRAEREIRQRKTLESASLATNPSGMDGLRGTSFGKNFV
jgi:hypothetical protein